VSFERAGELIRSTTPLADDDVVPLRAGDRVRLFGSLLTGRDAAHKRLCELLDAGQPLPIDLRGQIIYYVGPTPPPPGMVIGSAGPTTGGRMDQYAPRLMALGLKGMIGKGHRSQPVRDAMRQHRAVYFGAVGGAGALLSGFIKAAKIVAYEDLGTEAIRRLTVEDFPVIVVDDTHGNDLYEAGVKQYARPAGATS
jgi:fumarate hydratase subunit beta